MTFSLMFHHENGESCIGMHWVNPEPTNQLLTVKQTTCRTTENCVEVIFGKVTNGVFVSTETSGPRDHDLETSSALSRDNMLFCTTSFMKFQRTFAESPN